MGKIVGFSGISDLPGSQIAQQLPDKLSPRREQQILDYVRRGNYVLNWVPITVQRGPLSATFWVSSDALRLGNHDDSFRVATSAYTEQRIADELNAVMPTAMLSDETYRQAHIKLLPRPLGTEGMTTMGQMIRHHNEVQKQLDAAVGGAHIDPLLMLVAPVGKDWINSRRLLGSPTVNGSPAAINYGWHRTDMRAQPHIGPFPAVTGYPPLVVHQSEGMAHDYSHEDYSQVVRLVSRLVTVCRQGAPLSGFGGTDRAPGSCVAGEACTMADGSAGTKQCMDIYDVAQDPELNVLVSHNGPVYMRHFAVAYQPPQGQHQAWGGIQPAPPPPNTLTAPPAGDHPAGNPQLGPIDAPISGAATRIMTFAAGATLGWFLWQILG